MCGIVGLLLKNPSLRPRLGELMVPMMIGMTERGPDSAGLAVFTDPVGDGLFKIWGAAAKDKYAKMVPYIGQTVEVTGTEVTLSNNYDVRSFDLQTIKRKTTR